MSERPRQTHLTIEFDGERVIGELRDEFGSVSAFSGWLELLSALESLSKPVADTGRSGLAMHVSHEGGSTWS